MPDEEEIIVPERAPEQASETAIDEAENTAEIAIDIADNAHVRITNLEEQLAQLQAVITELQSEMQNDRTNAGDEPISIPEPDTGDNTETRPTTEEPIRPNREHFYFRKIF